MDDMSLSINLLPCLGGIIDVISPTVGTTNTNITITGNNFLILDSTISVTIGDYQCNLTENVKLNIDAITIICNINSSHPYTNTYMPVNEYYKVNVDQGYGFSFLKIADSSDRHFFLKPCIAHISPTFGSIGGGTLITVVGEGFVTNETEITVDGYACLPQLIDYTEIICITQPRTGDGTGVLEVDSYLHIHCSTHYIW